MRLLNAYSPNAFGLHDVHGNVLEWVEDCWNAGYSGAPVDGSARLHGNCGVRVLRGGSWVDRPRLLRAAFRGWGTTVDRLDKLRFRFARTF